MPGTTTTTTTATVAAGAAGAAAAHRSSVAAHRDGPFVALLGIAFVLTVVLFQTFSTVPLYLHETYGLPERTIGMLLGYNGLLIVLFEMVIVGRAERRAPLRVMALGTFLLCTGIAIVPFGRTPLFAALAFTVLTLGEMLSLPFANAIAADRAGEGARGAYMGLYSAAFSAAFVVAPAAGFFVHHRFGGATLYVGAGALGPLLALACLALQRAFVRPRAG